MSAFEQACRDAGLKLTHQRLEIFRELVLATDHPAAETLYHRLKKHLPTLSLDTIYRTLASLERHGLISRVYTTQSQARFELERRLHHHLICSNCSEIIDFYWESFDQSSLPENLNAWGKVKRKNVTVHGLCRKCLKKNTPDPA